MAKESLFWSEVIPRSIFSFTLANHLPWFGQHRPTALEPLPAYWYMCIHLVVMFSCKSAHTIVSTVIAPVHSAKVYLTSPEPLKKCHNFFILLPILKTLPPLESTQLSLSDDIFYYTWNLTSKKLAVCPMRKVCHKESTWYLYKQFT